MEKLLGIILLALVGSGVVYLFTAFVFIPVIKLFIENARLKR